jgi:hypothetical protein
MLDQLDEIENASSMIYWPLFGAGTAACLTLARKSLCSLRSARVIAAGVRSLETLSAHGQAREAVLLPPAQDD